MDVFEDEHEWLQVAELLRPAQSGPRQLCGRVLPFRGPEHPQRGSEQIGNRFALAAESQFLERVVRRVVVGDPRARLDHRGEGPVRDALPVRQRSPRERGDALERVEELGHQPRLAEPRLPKDGHEVRAPVADGTLEGVLEQLELGSAADERRRGETRRVVHAKCAPGPERFGPALDLECSDALHLDCARREAARTLADEDLPRLRGLLQPDSEVHRLARCERRLGVLDDHLTRLDADPCGKAERLDPGKDLERGAEGPFRMVLVRHGHAERSHHRIAGELLDDAAVLLDRLGDLLEVAVDPCAHDLRVGGCDERRRADQIDEDDGGDLPFHHHNLPARQAMAASPRPATFARPHVQRHAQKWTAVARTARIAA